MLLIAFIFFFLITALKDFGVAFKYWDLLRGVAGVVIVVALVINGLGL